MFKFPLSKTCVAASAALLISSAPAFAGGLGAEVVEPAPMAPAMAPSPAPSDWYVSVFAGGHQFQDVETDFYRDSYSVDFDTGFVAGFTVGKKISDTLRVEGELSFARSDANELDYYSDIYSVDGDLDATYLLANVWYDFPTSGPLGYYAGGGIGAAKVEADTTFDGNSYGYGPGETKLAAQLGAGVTYDLSQSLALDMGYRYKYVADVDFDDNDGEGVYTGADVESHSLQVGLMYNF